MKLVKIPFVAFVVSALSVAIMLSCEKDKKEQTPLSNNAKLNVEFFLTNQGKIEQVKEPIELIQNRTIEIEMLRYFISNMKFYTNEEDFQEPKENLFIVKQDRANENKFSIELPAGNYSKMTLYAGLDSATNAQNPLDFQREHPLSAFHNMHWSWSMQYRFVLMEFRVLHTTPTIPCSYHPGTNELLYGSEITFNQTLSLAARTENSLKIGIDLNALLDGPGGIIDIETETQAHADVHDFELTRKFMRNFAAALHHLD